MSAGVAPFVGRSAECARLDSLIDAAGSGVGGTILIVGGEHRSRIGLISKASAGGVARHDW